MLTKYDDLMCHQASTTFDHVVSSDRNWVERMWFGVHDKAGKHLAARRNDTRNLICQVTGTGFSSQNVP